MHANPYDSVPFDEIRAAIVGGVPRENVESLRSAARFLLSVYEKAPCDSDGVASCVRCNSVHLAKATLAALEGVQTVSEMARAHIEAPTPKDS